MKKLLSYAALLALFAAFLENTASFAGMVDNVKVSPYVQAGIQRVGSNMSLPVAAQHVAPPQDLQIDTLEIAVRDANFWAGTAGINVTASEVFSLFAAVGGTLDRPFEVNGTIPVDLSGLSTSANLQFTASNWQCWNILTGVGLGPILTGLYWDKSAMIVSDPRTAAGPIANQTLRGDFVTTTFCPYLGLALPVSTGLLTAIYSPLAYANTTLALRSSTSTITQLQYKWNKPGSFFSTNFQYNQNLGQSVSLGLWANYTWFDQRGNAQLEFEHGPPSVGREKDVTATMTKFILQGGLNLNVAF